MSVYKMQKKSRSGRRVEVRAERFEVNIPAIIICVLLALAIWLYIVNFSSVTTEVPPESPTEETQGAAESETAPLPSESADGAVAVGSAAEARGSGCV